DLELMALEAQMEQAAHGTRGSGDAANLAVCGTRLGALHGEYERLGGYAAASRAAQLAAGLGFAPEDLQHPVRQFSGGLQMGANLARALMRRSDVLLL